MVASTYFGYKKGFFKTVAGLLSIVISFALAVCFCSHVASFIKTTPVYDTIYQNIESHIKTPDDKSDDVYDYGAKDLNLPKEYIKDIESKVDGISQNVGETIAEKTTDIAVEILSMILILIAVRLLIFLLTALFGFLKKLPLIGWSDKLLGGFFGFIKGFAIAYLVLVVITVSATFNSENFLVRATKHSEFAKIMYNNNVFLDFLYKD